MRSGRQGIPTGYDARMNKTDLILEVAKRSGVDKKEVGRALNAALEVVKETVVKGQRVTLADFGTFQRLKRSARLGRNPRTGEEVPIPATFRPGFTPGRGFARAVSERKRTRKKAARRTSRR